jgi:NAD(P)-dependent dehydrogenase (short-subunit alcohol dehydrogenase family)
MYNPFSLETKTILVTGASSGIGRQCAIDCSKMGAKIIAVARNESRLDETLSKCDGGNHRKVVLDLTDFSTLSSVVKDLIADVGPLSGVVNCAGISRTELLRQQNYDKLNYLFQSNVYSSLLLTKEICKKHYYDETGASIIFLSSVVSLIGSAGKVVYAMTKGSLVSAARSLAVEYARKNIRFNAISPGVIETPINKNQPYLSDPDLRAKTESHHLLGLGQTTDISNAVIYLLSDASRWVTGQNLIVDGGYSII